MALPFRTYNAELLEVLASALEGSDRQAGHRVDIAGQVRWILKRKLTSGRPEISVVAGELSMSQRTLQRELARHGESFQSLLGEARREMAREYLQDASLELTEVAYLLGYEDDNSFYRAFRQWEGLSPGEWRKRVAGHH